MKMLRTASLALAASSALALFSATANADGYDYRGATAPLSWTGLYVGAHAGYGWGDVDNTLLTSVGVINACCGHPGIDALAGTRFDNSPKGWVGGGQVGYNVQRGNVVYGIEGTLSGGNLNDSSTRFASGDFGHPAEETINVRTKIDWMATVVGRLGYAPSNLWLAYVKAGYAAASIDTAINGSAFDPVGLSGSATFKGSSSKTHDGWTVGAGLEYMLAKNVILGVEYNYVDLGSERHAGTITCTNGTGICPYSTTPFATNVDPDGIHTVSARLSFKFGREEARPLK
jgi:outer membrane immunogenic protein